MELFKNFLVFLSNFHPDLGKVLLALHNIALEEFEESFVRPYVVKMFKMFSLITKDYREVFPVGQTNVHNVPY